MIKIGLCGTWHVHFKGYAKEFALNPNCTLAYLWDENEEKGREAAKELGVEFVSDLDDFFTRDFDAVLVCTSTNKHTEVYLKAAKAHKHIFTEKVLTSKLEDALKVKKAVLESNIKFCISFPWRSRADFLWVKNAVDTGLAGEINYVRMRNAHNGVSAGWLPNSFLDPIPTCGGAMMDLGAHSMYILNWLMGEPQSVQSTFTNFMCKTVEDNCVSVLKYKNGAIGVSETAFVAQNNPFSLEVVGTKGTIMSGGASDKLCYNTGDGWVYPSLGEDAEGAVSMFINGIINGTEIKYGIDDAVSLTKTMEMAYNIK